MKRPPREIPPAASAPAAFRGRTSRRSAPGPTVAGVAFGASAEIVPGSVFEDCTFEGTQLQERDLGASRFVDCTFVGANLSVANVDGSTFQGTAFRGCKLAGVDWSGVTRITSPVFEDCDLTRSAFLGLDLKKAVLRGCRARETVFSEADLTEADLTRCDLTGAQFGRTKLAGADLRGAIGYVIHPGENDVRGLRVSLPEAVGLVTVLGVVVDPLGR